MKKYLKLLPLFALLFLFTQNGFSVVDVNPVAEKIENIGTTDFSEKGLSIDDMLNLNNKGIEKKTGKKLKLKEKLALKFARKKIRKARKKGKSDSEIKAMLDEGKGGSKLGAFLLGFLLGLIGVLIVYLLMDRSFAKNAWFGLGVIFLLYLIIILAYAGAST